MAHVIDHALALHSAGLRVHPCRPRDKIPTVAGWQTRRLGDEDLRAEVGERSNLGVALGDQPGGLRLVVIDCDGARWLQWALDRFPPPVLMTQNSPDSGGHLWYAWDGPMPRKRVLGRDEHEKHSNAQLLTEGAQVVVPPSIHPSGRAYRWLVDGVVAGTRQAVAALGRLPRLCAADVLRVAPVERAKPRPEVRTAMRAVAAMGARPDAVDLLDAHKAAGALIKALPGGRYAVRCCWDAAHSSESLSSTAIGQGVDGRWWWRCLHASCEHRTTVEVIAALGFAPRAQNAPPSRRLERMTRRVGDW